MQLKLEDLLETPEASVKDLDGGSVAPLRLASNGQPVVRVPGLALMYTETVLGAPPLLPNLAHAWGALHRNVVFVTVRRVSSCCDMMPDLPLGAVLLTVAM